MGDRHIRWFQRRSVHITLFVAGVAAFGGSRMVKRPPPPKLPPQIFARVVAVPPVPDSPLLRWNIQTTVEEYKRVGRRSPRWDEFAISTLSLAARRASQSTSAYDDYAKAVGVTARKAVEAGCDDPLVLYYYCAFINDSEQAPLAGVNNDVCRSALAMKATDYSTIRKFWPFLRSATVLGEGAYSAVATKQQMLDEANVCLKELIEDPSVPMQELYKCTQNYLIKEDDIRKGWVPKWKELEPLWFRAHLNSVDALVLKGRTYINDAWKARGDGYADTVTEEGWRLFKERLTLADEVLRNAYRVDPKDPRPATFMIGVSHHVESSASESPQEWFVRAMKADTNNAVACAYFWNYLQPRWGGSMEALLEFGRHCALSPLYGDAVRKTLLDIHDSLSKEDLKTLQHYYEAPEVWADIQLVYEELLRRNPQNPHYGSEYRGWALRCGKPELVGSLGKPTAGRPR